MFKPSPEFLNSIELAPGQKMVLYRSILDFRPILDYGRRPSII